MNKSHSFKVPINNVEVAVQGMKRKAWLNNFFDAQIKQCACKLD